MDDNNNSRNPISSSTKPGLIARGITSRSSNSSNSSSSISNSPGYALNGKIMLCTVVVLFFAVVIILGFHTYARWLFRGRSRRRGHHPAGRLRLDQAASAAAPKGGLDAAVLKFLPTFTFYADGKTPDNNLGDCPVCLSEFEDGEAGRALPKCGHAFHVECIDMWFETHSNCPICRAPVQARPDAKAVSVDQAAVPPPVQDNGDGNSSSSNSRPAELVGISVEAPPLSMEERFRGSIEEQGSGSDGGNRAKSPGKSVISMKRIWSV